VSQTGKTAQYPSATAFRHVPDTVSSRSALILPPIIGGDVLSVYPGWLPYYSAERALADQP